MQTASSVDMLHRPLTGKLIRFALPIAASSMLQQLFNAADTAVAVAGCSGAKSGAVNAAGPVVNDHRPCCSILTSTQTKSSLDESRELLVQQSWTNPNFFLR